MMINLEMLPILLRCTTLLFAVAIMLLLRMKHWRTTIERAVLWGLGLGLLTASLSAASLDGAVGGEFEPLLLRGLLYAGLALVLGDALVSVARKWRRRTTRRSGR